MPPFVDVVVNDIGAAMGGGTRRAMIAAAVVLTVASLVVLVRPQLTWSEVARANTATIGGLTVEVRAAEWVDMGHIHDGRGDFLPPDQMMPGAPRGDQVRLGIGITLINTDSRTRGFSLADEFSVIGGRATQPQPLRADSIGALPRLAPGAAVKGTLYFDIEVPSENDPPLYLRWTRDGHTTLIAVPLGEGVDHDHG